MIRVSEYSNSSERLALINTSEEMGQARDISTHVTFNALNSTSSEVERDTMSCRRLFQEIGPPFHGQTEKKLSMCKHEKSY